ncbi:MAG: hypothetical protein J4F46_03345 [Dehalococcoidia bacterium]|nr:hypothetical protein [Dehalococcoidia bacterium]
MLNITLFCPHHLEDETIGLPDSYRYFEGEIQCNPTSGAAPHPLEVWIIRGLLVDVERSRHYGFTSPGDESPFRKS